MDMSLAGPSHTQTVDLAFAARVASTPSAVALEVDGRRVTYAELDQMADGLAHALLARGVKPGSMVGTRLPRSVEAIAAFLAVLKVGCAYVPFDSSYPPETRRSIAELCQPAAMVASPALLAAEATWAPTVWLESGVIDAGGTPLPPPPTNAGSPAYVMFTSGSTGRPKGVVVPHRAILRLVLQADYVKLDASETLLQASPLAFDASTFEIWGALLNGGRLAILPHAVPGLDDIAQAIVRHGVTTLWLTAGLFHMMVDHRLEALRPLRQLLAGGDVLSVPHVRRVLQALPDCRLINGYGPTENTTFTCCYTVPRAFAGDSVPIGRAISGTHVAVLDDALQPVADGEPGQLCAGGAGVALGYLGDPERTAEAFRDDPAAPGRLIYLTGDLVRRRPDGVLEFCGRADRQVKIDGKRVELDAIEAAVRASGLVHDAAVTFPAFPDGVRRLICHLRPLPEHAQWEPELRAHLKATLPDHMIPGWLIALSALPMTPAGKIDRRALPMPDAAAPPAKPADDGDLSTVLRAIWGRHLGRNVIGLDDSFFDLGGTSLVLIGVHAEVQRITPRPVSLIDLFAHPTIRQLVARLQRGEETPGATLDVARLRAERQAGAIQRLQRRHRTVSQ
jgi:amino acid adenylation domain-containing protein